ncbi:thiosulfate dehydrogenase [quinone] large subunit [Isoptericola sp. CG 20/1183]|uniref:Thiosulfate dehydrogenase [quinone] large subunit n=1 Tax=Isoptericola halotolerans TaxID=300560 RepID=A0ABX5ECF0_9MICO|nr:MULTISPECIES: DoxX family protein [Isoptericola]PRZ05247.1 thiosulfate dehydrogenase [quinone] large subunit [Isoptericola halotolerans]PRZ05985.1 thiosulfate dehydrogenase [quinone] large subunit [Isoptericola sp. CG 20/1183]
MATISAPTSSRSTAADAGSPVAGVAARRALACCRLLLAVVFLWPVADKAFGLGYATPPEAAWLTTGTSPTAGYLEHAGGPLSGGFAALSGPVVDALYMLGLLGTGLALLLGIGMRAAAVAGGLLMLSLWLSTWPFAAGSHNPLVDEHVVYIALLVTLALTRAGDTWGLGRAWAASPVPGARTWLR